MQSKFLSKDCVCYENRDIICLHCAKYVKQNNRRPITDFHQRNYEQVYDNLPDLTFSYKPTVFCDACAKYLQRRAEGSGRLKYLTPVIFKKPKKNHQNCYTKQVHQHGLGVFWKTPLPTKVAKVPARPTPLLGTRLQRWPLAAPAFLPWQRLRPRSSPARQTAAG